MTREQAETMTATDAAISIGVDLRGDDGQPYCCGRRMHVKSGILGVDYAKCLSCGNLLYRIDSPHTNGGYVLREDVIEGLGDRVWVARRGDGDGE